VHNTKKYVPGLIISFFDELLRPFNNAFVTGLIGMDDIACPLLNG
jgi:hypothetical protein